VGGAIRAVQYGLFADEFDLDDERRAFAERFVAGGCVNQMQALIEARGQDAESLTPRRKNYLKKRACLLTSENETARYIEQLRQRGGADQLQTHRQRGTASDLRGYGESEPLFGVRQWPGRSD